MHEVHGIPDPTAAVVPPAGRTDGEIARADRLQSGGVGGAHRRPGAGGPRGLLPRIRAPLPRRSAAHVAPGMPELLAGLAAREGTRWPCHRQLRARRAAQARPRRDGHQFAPDQGGFGSDHEDRAALPAIAAPARGVNGEPGPRADTSSSATPPATSRCARADGVAAWPWRPGPSGRSRWRGRTASPPTRTSWRACSKPRFPRERGPRATFQGIREGVPFGIAAALVGFSFGVLAQPVMGATAAIVMSAILFAGSAQFAALACSRRVAAWWRRSSPAA